MQDTGDTAMRNKHLFSLVAYFLWEQTNKIYVHMISGKVRKEDRAYGVVGLQL